jgi:hypothetical protein
MPTTESAISGGELAALLLDAKEGLAISAPMFATIFMDDVRELEEFARVPPHTAEREPPRFRSTCSGVCASLMPC